GNVGKWPIQVNEHGARWTGEAGKFWAALVEVEYIEVDELGMAWCKDWPEWGGAALVEKIRKNRGKYVPENLAFCLHFSLYPEDCARLRSVAQNDAQIRGDESREDYKESSQSAETESAKAEEVSKDDVEECYTSYPTTTLRDGKPQSTGKRLKDKDEIRRILKGRYPLLLAIRTEVQVKAGNYLKDFHRFLKNLPDPDTITAASEAAGKPIACRHKWGELQRTKDRRLYRECLNSGCKKTKWDHEAMDHEEDQREAKSTEASQNENDARIRLHRQAEALKKKMKI
ncbi:MAG: hypothetical protein IID28_11470, partial [Planctomycetes bacterium]|nr:hypothetical protein [Planctomycetota bacterium]